MTTTMTTSMPATTTLRGMTRRTALAVLGASAVLPGSFTARDVFAAAPVRFEELRLLLCFQGKGSCLPYDAGVLDEVYARMDALREQRVVVIGNSSGSIPAAYFSCHGFSDATVTRAIRALTGGERDAVRSMENPQRKLTRVMKGERTEISLDNLRAYIAFVLGVDRWGPGDSIAQIVQRSQVRPQYPLLISAINKEVLEDSDPQTRLTPRGFKEFDPATLTVRWRPEVYDFYRQHPQQFARQHPDLRLGPDRRIGHALTYFVDRATLELLQQVPAEERSADLRLVESPADIALAMQASLAEPTYFDPIPEPDLRQVLAHRALGDLEGIQRRTYFGGYLSPLAVQDLRRMLPDTYVLGTGFRHHPLLSRRIGTGWLLADVEIVAQHAEWWADTEVIPDAEFQSHMNVRDLTAQQEFQFGKRRARQCLDDNVGRPTFVRKPKFTQAAPRAIYATGKPPTTPGELPTLRGVQALLKS